MLSSEGFYDSYGESCSQTTKYRENDGECHSVVFWIIAIITIIMITTIVTIIIITIIIVIILIVIKK